MPLKFGTRVFSPQPLTTVLAARLIVSLLTLGRWQLRRAEEKRVIYESPR